MTKSHVCSELFKTSKNLHSFSPNHKLIAYAFQYKLNIMDAENLRISHVFSCLDKIQLIEWANNSKLILCGLIDRGMVQIFKLDEPDWFCRIDEGTAGLIGSFWAPDGNHVLTMAHLYSKITIWSLINDDFYYIKWPKSCKNGVDFSSDGAYLAVVERRELKDYLSIFSCCSWELMKTFKIDSDEVNGVKWTPHSKILCVWTNSLSFKVLFYTCSGHVLGSYFPHEHALGIKSVLWNSSGQLLAIGSFDRSIRILNNLTWTVITEFTYNRKLRGDLVGVLKEVSPEVGLQRIDMMNSSALNPYSTKYQVISTSVTLPEIKNDPNRPIVKTGTHFFLFSPGDEFLASINDSMPSIIWIWSMSSLRLVAVLWQIYPIKAACWHPTVQKLIISTGGSKLYVWEENDRRIVSSPDMGDFEIDCLRWREESSDLAASGRHGLRIFKDFSV